MAPIDVTYPLPVATDSATRVFCGAADRWLPQPAEQRPGLGHWLLYPGTGSVGVAVDARIGEPWVDGSTTWRLLSWEPSVAWSAEHLPAFEGDVGIRALPDATTWLLLRGAYRPPHGLAGLAADRLILRRVAAATAHGFLQAMGQRLALACAPASVAGPATAPRTRTS